MAHAKYFQEWLATVKNPRPVLLVEDNEDDCAIILEMSKTFNIHWEVSHSYESAIDLLKQKGGEFKLIILDLHLGSSQDGTFVFREVKRRWPKIPVVVFSGHITCEAIAEMTKIGFVMFAQKPASFDHRFFSQLFSVLNIPKRLEPGNETSNEQSYE